METQALTPSLRDALASLLDDPSDSVRRALLTHFKNLGDAAPRFLREIAEGENRVAAIHARWFLTELHFADPVNEFRGFIRSMSYELETGMLLMCRTAYPQLDVTTFCGGLDRIASRCRELMAEPMHVRDKILVLNRVLFHELGFRGNVEHYTDPENVFLNRLLETRRGIPISLSVLYLLIAERCSLRLEPIGLPGHFLVGCFLENHPLFIDTFDHGRLMAADDVTDMMRAREIDLEESHLAPTTIREVLSRCCRNLAHYYSSAQKIRFAKLFAGFVAEFDQTYEENTHP